MKHQRLGQSALECSVLAYGCWRLAGSEGQQRLPSDQHALGRRAVITAYEAGYTLFDLADIYGGGECEKIFGEALQEVAGMRERIVVATKCGIRRAGEPTADAPFRYDFSHEHMLAAVDRSLARMRVEMIDLLMLHRPDCLMDPAEVAGVFAHLRQTGKVREFGVSNFKPAQVTLLKRACPMPLCVNQVEFSLANLMCLEDGTLDQCLGEHVTPLAWSPLAGGKLGNRVAGVLPSQTGYRVEAVNVVLDALAREHSTTRPAVALAWLLKHPAKIIPIIGSTSPENIRAALAAGDLELTREEWYRLLEAARGARLP